ncbi:hypothetical protein FQZ97_1199930 [compost metagenome]
MALAASKPVISTVPWAVAKLCPTRLAKLLLVRSSDSPPTLRDLRLSSPSGSPTLKVPLTTVLPSPALEPPGRPRSKTWARPPSLCGKLTPTVGVSLLPVMLIVRVEALESPSPSRME